MGIAETKRILALEKRIRQLELKIPPVSAWVDWTPTVDQNGAVTVTVSSARYIVWGPIAIVQTRLQVTGGGSAGNAISIQSIPSIIQPANTGGALYVIGTGWVQDSGTGFYGGSLSANGASDWRMVGHNETSWIGVDPSVALANGDRIGIDAVYERA